MDEVAAIKAISDALGNLKDADERGRVLAWAQAKFGKPGSNSPVIPAPTATAGHNPTPSASPTSKPKPTKKAKTIIAMDKTLNLAPPGKESAVHFAAAKAPSNVREKCVVSVYYLRDFIGLEKVSAQAVFTFFKFVQWPAPADMKNTLQQAGSSGWLDTASSDDIKLTSSGENLVEHQLPAKTKA